MHHRMKVDAPSGTRCCSAKRLAQGRGLILSEHSERQHVGLTSACKPDAIGFASLRDGAAIGDHNVIFAGNGGRIALSHHAEDRALFARGALERRYGRAAASRDCIRWPTCRRF